MRQVCAMCRDKTSRLQFRKAMGGISSLMLNARQCLTKLDAGDFSHLSALVKTIVDLLLFCTSMS